MYIDYIKERENKEIVQHEHGFALYSYFSDGIYLSDIYIKPEHRQLGIATDLADEVVKIAKTKNLKKLYGSVSTLANNFHLSMHVLEQYGLKVCGADKNIIWYSKELN